MNSALTPRLFVSPTLTTIGFLLRVVEPVLMMVCSFVAYALRKGTFWAPTQYMGLTLMTVLAYMVVSSLAGTYRPEVLRNVLVQLSRLVVAVLVTFALLVVLMFMFKISSQLSRVWLVVWMILWSVSLLVLRGVVMGFCRRLIRKGQMTRTVAVLGTGNKALAIADVIRKEHAGFRLHGLYSVDERDVMPDLSRTDMYRGQMPVLISEGLKGRFDELIVALDLDQSPNARELLNVVHRLPVNVYYCLPLPMFDRGVGQLPGVGRLPLVPLFRKPIEGPGLMLKRLVDITLSGAGLLALAPVLAAVAVAVKVSSPGPVFFRQRRGGFNGEEFDMLKFRSMRMGEAPKDDAGKEKQATRNDPRITLVGRVIRRTSLDELPQLINILKGDMSLVGPRPHVPSHNSYYESLVDRYASRHKMKPGLTGWAQLHGWRGETETLDKMIKRVEHDIWYVENWSLGLDLRILLMTPVVMVFHKGAY